MRKFVLMLILPLLSFSCFAGLPMNQYVTQDIHHYVTVFKFSHIATGESEGYVVRQKNDSTLFYQAYDANDQFLGSAEYTNNGSKAYVANLKLFNADGKQAGAINGEFWTTQPAKYAIKADDFEGAAYLSGDKIEFVIFDKENNPMVQLYRHIVKHKIDYWEIHALEQNKVSEATIKLFAAFASDTHSQFIIDD